jgi:4-amino-4-deoxy-L-arabinose transferase-like glycosyltransferase
MPAAQLLLVLVLLVVCSFAPGFFFVRRFDWNPLEKLCGSVALSLVLLYLAGWGIYVLAPGSQPGAYFAVSAVCAGLAVAARRDLRAFAGIARVRRALAGFGFLTVWTFLVLAMIRVYSGGVWSGDWLEHFQRCLFFLQRFPVRTAINLQYQLPARPPLMNVLGAFFLGQAGDRFEVFQLVFLFLNLLPFLAGCLLIPALAGRRIRLGKWAVLPLAGIFAMSPLVMENATYAWTKALPAFFVILAISLYLAALRKGDSRRRVAAFLALAAGFLTHYSAGPYVVVLTLHYLYTVVRKRGAYVKEACAIAGLCGLLLLTWFGWSLAVYGARTTIASNTAVTDARKYPGGTLEKIAGNLFDSVAPSILRDPGALQAFDQPNRAGFIRDNAFVIYQTNLVFGMGALGGPLVVWLLALGVARRKSCAAAERRFWIWLVPAVVVLGIAVVGERDVNGVAHLTLVPMEMIGLVWLAANFRRRRWAAWLILAGALVDFPLGVMLQARVQNLENSPGHTIFTGLSFAGGGISAGAPGPESLSRGAWVNWLAKQRSAKAREFVGEIDRKRGEGMAPTAEMAAVRASLQELAGEDRAAWGGWFSRHGGSVAFIGDAFGEGWVPCALLWALWLGLLWMLWRHLPPAAAPVQAMAAAARKTRRTGAGRKR